MWEHLERIQSKEVTNIQTQNTDDTVMRFKTQCSFNAVTYIIHSLKCISLLPRFSKMSLNTHFILGSYLMYVMLHDCKNKARTLTTHLEKTRNKEKKCHLWSSEGYSQDVLWQQQ